MPDAGLVHIDADDESVQGRLNLLATRLQDTGQTARDKSELIAIVVPRRNIETWIHGLGDASVKMTDDFETYDFKKDEKHRIAANRWKIDDLCGQRIGPAAKRFYSLTRIGAGPIPENMPSVAVAVTELRRLER